MVQHDLLTALLDDHITPAARICPRPVREMLRRTHRHLGHPSNQSRVCIMQAARFQEVAIVCARCLNCPTCLRQSQPQRVQRAAMLYRPTIFNHMVGLDLKFVRDSHGTPYTLMCAFEFASMNNNIFFCNSSSPSDVANTVK